MRLLGSTDIALRVLMLLARDAQAPPVSAEALATALGGQSRNHLHKIIQELNGLGVTRTVRGVGGGVTLAIPPAEIDVGAIIRALEADQALVECFRADGGACTLAPDCRLRRLLRQAKEAFYARLDGRTLAEVAA